MFEQYLWLFLIPIIGMGITAICMSIWIFWPDPVESKHTKYKSEHYDKDYYKTKQYINISDVIQKELAKRNHKL